MTGILEAIYHRVPIVGIANFADQVDNAIRIQDKGLGVSISKHNLNHETIFASIQEVMTNERYQQIMMTINFCLLFYRVLLKSYKS